MTECANEIANVAISANGTGVGGVATVFTVGCSYYCVVVMSECIGIITDVAVTANGTGIGGVATVFTVGCSYYHVVLVSKRRDFGLCDKRLAADGTDNAIGKTGVGTIWRFACYCLLGVSECRNLVCSIAIAANGTSIGCVTAVYAIGCGYFSIVVMSGSGHGCSIGMRGIMLTGIGD